GAGDRGCPDRGLADRRAPGVLLVGEWPGRRRAGGGRGGGGGDLEGARGARHAGSATSLRAAAGRIRTPGGAGGGPRRRRAGGGRGAGGRGKGRHPVPAGGAGATLRRGDAGGKRGAAGAKRRGGGAGRRSPGPAMNKNAMRSAARARVAALGEEERRAAGEEIARRVWTLPEVAD